MLPGIVGLSFSAAEVFIDRLADFCGNFQVDEIRICDVKKSGNLIRPIALSKKVQRSSEATDEVSDVFFVFDKKRRNEKNSES